MIKKKGTFVFQPLIFLSFSADFFLFLGSFSSNSKLCLYALFTCFNFHFVPHQISILVFVVMQRGGLKRKGAHNPNEKHHFTWCGSVKEDTCWIWKSKNILCAERTCQSKYTDATERIHSMVMSCNFSHQPGTGCAVNEWEISSSQRLGL